MAVSTDVRTRWVNGKICQLLKVEPRALDDVAFQFSAGQDPADLRRSLRLAEPPAAAESPAPAASSSDAAADRDADDGEEAGEKAPWKAYEAPQRASTTRRMWASSPSSSARRRPNSSASSTSSCGRKRSVTTGTRRPTPERDLGRPVASAKLNRRQPRLPRRPAAFARRSRD